MRREKPVHQRFWSVFARLFHQPENVLRAIRGYLDDYLRLTAPTRKIFLDLSDVSRLRQTGPRTQKIFLDLKS